ncbi:MULTISPECIES: NCS1 family nucleobase:cation symporter-1 [Vibrio]|jgi:NCS1 family nucleobase:cation symporter-1|uniref:Amino acid transporter n=1 Tax=Vibrio natriegens NBRC 15636 = ATCC 14048 = DSM 759 TaxID=1219067 RepID=A0AAN0Y2K3_VIBNA|nr:MULTISPECIES: NCS1 family nucleobase:cation symporter-1 [Vibrio]MEE3878025.1 NCS1 family nucleobase:cation symporter-1 [Vibrio sp. YYF0003]CAH0529021.1 putative allantoin permease [Catenococcus thiocycli]ALR15615.1 amino acid transporter [Vibrio natriegens NBRC 15636 = ATCC 14048 = DSM 759]ANQ12528.1 amino acid transporter [Vibrio natriegens NBRC 15636 = ATCC 14048 = DSM 759]ANQ17311.1 amino acid transporter [Vibrio natriegens]
MKKELPVSPRLSNEDLAPEKEQKWGWYSIFAFWMSDVHSVGGYVFAASLFALGLNGIQVFISLLAGISIVLVFANLMGKPGQKAGVPFPVVARMSFGVFGANIPAVIRGIIAVVWYGIQTYLASSSFIILLLYFFPSMESLANDSFLGLSYLGWVGFSSMWVLQAIVFMFGMDMIRKVIDWSGPAIYIAMFALCAYMINLAGWENISFNLGKETLVGSEAIIQMIIATALVAGYFAGPTLNFSDFSRYCTSYKDLKLGNLLGLPLNFIVFSLFSVVIVSASIPVFGEMIVDPVETVKRLDSGLITVLGALTFIFATVGINIVANFVAPAFDFSNVSPQKISFKMGGFIAAFGSILLTPWNLFNNPEVIHYTVDVLAAMIGPLYGIIIVDYFIVKKGQIDVPSLYTESPQGQYWYKNGVNMNSVYALVIASVAAIIATFFVTELANYALFIGGFVSAIVYKQLMQKKLFWVSKAALAKQQ